MARLPIPGEDADKWGDILNEFLSASHAADGTIKPAAITSTAIQDSSVSGSKLQDTSITVAKLDAGLGTDGQLLTKDSTQTSGIKWSSPSITMALTSFFKTGTLTLTTGVNRLPIDSPYTVVGVRLTVGTAPTGANIIVDIKKNGSSIYTTQANRPTITAGQTAGGPGVAPDVPSLSAGDYITVDIVQVGSSTAGADLNVSIVVSKTL